MKPYKDIPLKSYEWYKYAILKNLHLIKLSIMEAGLDASGAQNLIKHHESNPSIDTTLNSVEIPNSQFVLTHQPGDGVVSITILSDPNLSPDKFAQLKNVPIDALGSRLKGLIAFNEQQIAECRALESRLAVPANPFWAFHRMRSIRTSPATAGFSF